MKLEVNSIEYTNFTSATAEIRLDTLSNSFSFEAVESLPFKGGEPCRVIVDNEPVVTGYIETVAGDYDAGSHSLFVSGRDKTGDLVDSTLDAMDDIKLTSLKSIIEQVITALELNITVLDFASPEDFNESEDIATPEAGQNAFEFIETLARNRHVLLTSDSDGNIIIEQTANVGTSGTLQNILGASDNNIKSASFSYDRTGRYNVYRFRSMLDEVALNNAGTVGIATIVNQNGSIIDTEIRVGRQLSLIAESSMSDDGCVDRAIWEANIRKARGQMYSAVVQGYRTKPGGLLWSPNSSVVVVDNFANIDATMLINSVRFNMDVDGGRTTEIQCIERNAYSLTLEEPVSQELGF